MKCSFLRSWINIQLFSILGIKNRYKMIFQHYRYIHLVPDIASVNKDLSVILNELDIYPIITTKGARHKCGANDGANQL